MTDPLKRVSVSAGDRPDWKLCHAVLVYSGGGHSGRSDRERSYATVHEVHDVKGTLRLAAGAPATREACADLARTLGANAGLSGFTPEALLYLGARSIAWWRPPGRARIYFDTTGAAAGDQAADKTGAALIGKRSGAVQHPGLVFAVNARGWFVYAVQEATRPTPQTKLFRAPYFNVWTSGQICAGNVKLPETLSPRTLAEYERAFFGSNFTHPNTHGKDRLVKTGNAYAFWSARLDAGEGEPFPIHALNPLQQTLATLARKLDDTKEHE